MTQLSANNIAIVILAAGFSSRLGTAKQLLQYNNRTLLGNTIEVAKNSVVSNILVVIPNDPQIQESIMQYEISVQVNGQRHLGISSSIRLGIEYWSTKQDIHAVIFLVCDQPLLSPEIINSVVSEYLVGKFSIIACGYEKTYGIPALFSRERWNELLQLSGDQGAKKIIAQRISQTKIIPFSAGNIDVDTPQQYQDLLQNFPKNL